MDNTQLMLCDHCGEKLCHSEVEESQNYHTECERGNVPRCEDAVRCFQDSMAINPNVLYMGIDVRYLYGVVDSKAQDKKEKREKRNRKLTELTEHISALRNSGGGYLLVQVIGLSPDENYMGAFDEFADDTLYKMIEDGSLFECVYKKGRLSNIEECCNFTEFISLFVTKGTFWSTSDFKTKVSLDVGLQSPLPNTMKTFVTESRRGAHVTVEPSFKFEGDFSRIQTLQEQRDIQLKGFKPDMLKRNWSELSTDEKARALWDLYRLNEYISAFTKNKLGGSIILGIGEKEKANKIENKDSRYKSKELEIHGITLDDETDFVNSIKQIAREKCRISNFSGKDDSSNPVIKVKCTKVPPEYVPKNPQSEESQHYIVELAVYPVHGVVFYDKDGPVSCHIIENKRKRVSCETWFQMMKKAKWNVHN